MTWVAADIDLTPVYRGGLTGSRLTDAASGTAQPSGLFYRSQTEIEQAHIASALVFELSKIVLEHVRNRVMANLRNVDEDLATRVANGLNMDLPAKSKAAVEPEDMDLSPALRIVGKYPESLLGRWVGILVTDGADGRLVKAVRKAAEGEGATVKIVAPKVGGVTLKDGSKLKADGQLAGTPSVLFDAVALVVSEEGAASCSTTAPPSTMPRTLSVI